MKILKDFLAFLYWRFFSKIIRILPLKADYFIADLSLTIFSPLFLFKKRFLQKVFKEFFHDIDENKCMKASSDTLRLLLKNQIDVMRYPLLSSTNIDEYVTYDGVDNLDQALATGKGVLLMFGHFGANQFIIPALGHKGFKINQISTFPGAWEEISGKKTGKLKTSAYTSQKECESYLPVKFLDIKKNLRPALRCLENGEILLVAFDGRGGGKWEKVDFLGHKANISSVPFQLAIKTKASILPAYVLRSHNGKHILKIEKLIYTGEKKDPQSIINRFMEWFEIIVRKHPEHYLWLLQAAMIRGDLDEVPLFDIISKDLID
ncbi:lysophospholipid acyltransferase family protein [bacterium]|nr:lysophospholipid acyltransferase family protein [bacterium]